MSDSLQLTRDQISAAIAEKAWKDEAFHKEVLANPNKVYEQYIGKPLPAGMTIKVVEDTATTVHFVIPGKPANAGELSDAELENVAGGITPTGLVASAVLSAFTSVATSIGKANNW
jgi:hypothetical protein